MKKFISTKTLQECFLRAEISGMEPITVLQFLKGSGAADPRRIPALTSGWMFNFDHPLMFPKPVAPGTSSYRVLHCVPWTKAQKSGSTLSAADTGERLSAPCLLPCPLSPRAPPRTVMNVPHPLRKLFSNLNNKCRLMTLKKILMTNNKFYKLLQ